MPPLRDFALGQLFATAAAHHGYHPFPVPAAILSQPYRGRSGCTYCSYCRTGCHVGAKSNVLVSVLPEVMLAGSIETRTGWRITEIVADDAGRPAGVRCVGPDGEAIQPAETIVLAAYTFENVRLLLNSRSRAFPAGLGNGHDQVGRYFITRQQPFVWGEFAGRRLNRFTGPTSQAHAIDDFNADNFDHTGLGFIRGAKLWVNNGYPPISTMSRVVPPGVPRWGAAYKEYLRSRSNSMGELRIMPEVLPYHANRLDLDPDVTDRLGMPVVRITFDIYENERRLMGFMQDRAAELLSAMGATGIWRTGFFQGVHNGHEFGGARMGADPARSVTDGYGRLHEAPNVIVLGGATLPTMPGLNPTLTLQALALRTGAELAGLTMDDLRSRL